MKPLRHLLFFDQKIAILQAADEFKFQLDNAKAQFDYSAAIRLIGSKAFGIRYFYEQSSCLLDWIYKHKVFIAVMPQHIASGYRAQIGRRFTDLQPCFTNLQHAATSLLMPLLKALQALEKASRKSAVRSPKLDHRLGIDILRMISRAKTEQFWIDLFKAGFEERYPGNLQGTKSS